MTALAPPEARDERERELREPVFACDCGVWTAHLNGRLLYRGYSPRRARRAAEVAMETSPLIAALRRKVAEADDASADLRIKLVETTEEADSTFDALCSASARAGRAEAERDALAEMVGEVAMEVILWFITADRVNEAAGIAEARARDAEAREAAATARATEAEARASRANDDRFAAVRAKRASDEEIVRLRGVIERLLAEIDPARTALSPADPSQSAEGAGQPQEPTP